MFYIDSVFEYLMTKITRAGQAKVFLVLGLLQLLLFSLYFDYLALYLLSIIDFFFFERNRTYYNAK